MDSRTILTICDWVDCRVIIVYMTCMISGIERMSRSAVNYCWSMSHNRLINSVILAQCSKLCHLYLFCVIHGMYRNMEAQLTVRWRLEQCSASAAAFVYFSVVLQPGKADPSPKRLGSKHDVTHVALTRSHDLEQSQTQSQTAPFSLCLHSVTGSDGGRFHVNLIWWV